MQARLLKFNQSLLLFVLLTVVLYHGRPILIPLLFAILLAMLMAPLCRRLDGNGFHRTVSCLICVFILLVVFLGMLAILVGQISGFVRDVALLEQNANALLLSVQSFIEQKFDIPAAEQTEFIRKETKNMGQFLRVYLTGVLRSSVQLLAGLIITLVLTYLFLFHKEKYYAFFLQFTAGNTQQQKEALLTRISQVSQHYLVGRAISIITLFVLYAIALFIIGVKNALLLAAVAGLFNIIPFLGPILAAVFPFLVALVTEDSYQPAIWVLVSFCLFQALDNYYVTPYFLGGEVSLSALSTIVIMICGGYVWGIAGMILFIPMLSIVKIICDAVPGLQPYGDLIGDSGTRPSAGIKQWFRTIFGRTKKRAPKN